MANGKKSNLDSGFLLLYDWLPAFSTLNAAETKELLFALIDRQRNGTPFPVFDSELVNVFAKMMEPTIERRLQGQDGGKKAQSTAQDTTVGAAQDTTVGTTIPSRAEIRKTKRSISAEKSSEAERRFNTFWDSYPLKVGKEDARKAFYKISPDDALLTTMLDALEKHKKSSRWTANNGRYIHNPSTWLNQKRWEDELPDENAGAHSDSLSPDYSDAERYSHIKME